MKNSITLVALILCCFSISCKKENSNPELNGVTFSKIKSITPPYELVGNIVDYSDIIKYDSTDHIFILSDIAKERINKVEYPVTPTPFAIALDGNVIYIANFIPGYSSMSCETCITIEPYSADNQFMVNLGYPGSDYFTGPDPRNDSRLITRFVTDNKLK
jgi:hypothetical protein